MRITKMINLKKQVSRIPYRIKGYGWHIVIDDGFCAYRYPLKASERESINSLYKKIIKSIK